MNDVLFSLVTRRGWKERWFSRPWKPWATLVSHEFHGYYKEVVAGDDTVTTQVETTGPIQVVYRNALWERLKAVWDALRG